LSIHIQHEVYEEVFWSEAIIELVSERTAPASYVQLISCVSGPFATVDKPPFTDLARSVCNRGGFVAEREADNAKDELSSGSHLDLAV